jgi:hypothetical protein
MIPSPLLIFVGVMLPVLLLIGLVSLLLRWQDMRWHVALGGLTGVATLCARYLGQVRMARLTAAGLTATNWILAVVGSLAVAPGTTDSFACWVGNASGIAVATVYFIRGSVFGLPALALDMSALTVGLLETGDAISPGIWAYEMPGISSPGCACRSCGHNELMTTGTPDPSGRSVMFLVEMYPWRR